MSLADFEKFIDNFLAALRDYDRAKRGAQIQKSGRPERRAEAVTAFRLVDFKPGSGIATVEPEMVGVDEDPLFDQHAPALSNLNELVHDFEQLAPLPPAVIDELESACRTLGSDGSITVTLPAHRAEPADRVTEITTPCLEAIRRKTEEPPARDVDTVSGRLHLLDLEPDKLAIRDSSGVDWACRYPEELEPKVLKLAGRLVWAHGQGRQTSPQRGSMTIDRIEPVEQGEQTSLLFTTERVGLDRLIEEQGVRPQELESLGAPEWTDEDDAYLAALTED